jgi:hypothetical protein
MLCTNWARSVTTVTTSPSPIPWSSPKWQILISVSHPDNGHDDSCAGRHRHGLSVRHRLAHPPAPVPKTRRLRSNDQYPYWTESQIQHSMRFSSCHLHRIAQVFLSDLLTSKTNKSAGAITGPGQMTYHLRRLLSAGLIRRRPTPTATPSSPTASASPSSPPSPITRFSSHSPTRTKSQPHPSLEQP